MDSPQTRFDPSIVSAHERIREMREALDNEGVLVDGTVYDASGRSAMKALLVFAFAVRDPNYTAILRSRDGNEHVLNSEQIYRVAVAIVNHTQRCDSWETRALESTELEIGTNVDTWIDRAPFGDTRTPDPPEGMSVPPKFDAPIVGGSSGCTGVGGTSLSIVPNARAKRNQCIRAGSFWWRRGDPMPKRIFIKFLLEGCDVCVPVAKVYDVSRRTCLGKVISGMHVSTAQIELTGSDRAGDTSLNDGDEHFFELEVVICNYGRKGTVALENYAVIL